MCVRFSPLTAEEAQAVLDARGTGRHGIRYIEAPDPLRDARPGSTAPLFVPDGVGGLRVANLEWGFPLDGKPHAVFNTRIESALEQRYRQDSCALSDSPIDPPSGTATPPAESRPGSGGSPTRSPRRT